MAKTWPILWLALISAGCAGAVDRFPHSVVRDSYAPWDGAATELLLAEKPLSPPAPAMPYVALRVPCGLVA